MKFLLSEDYCLRGWKNMPYALCSNDFAIRPVPIPKELCDLLSEPFDFDGRNPVIGSLYDQGIIRPCFIGDGLSESQRYYDYGCLHFDSVIFSITGKCNYKCMHCSVFAPSDPMGEISFGKICDILDQMKECGLNNIVMIGGEPLIRKDFLEVVDAVTERNMRIAQIFTNGSLITEQLLDALAERGLDKTLFMLSFDGVGFHDAMRGIKGAEENFYKKIDLLSSKGFPIACNMCVTKESIHSLWDTIRYLADHNVTSLTVYPPASCGLWKTKNDELGASTDLVADVYEKVIEDFVSDNYPLDLNLYGLAYFDSRMKKFVIAPKWRTRKAGADRSNACVTFTQELNISPEGILSPCYAMMSEQFVRKEMPDLNKMTLREALTDSPFTRLVELTVQDIKDHNPECAECEYIEICGCGCRMQAFEETGDFMGIDPRSCEFFKGGGMDRFRAAARKGAAKREEARKDV
ncbi:MAG: radical SAM protein [Clostridiales bacterium]|nr:radical SAM protein [Clostridiales bacterium]